MWTERHEQASRQKDEQQWTDFTKRQARDKREAFIKNIQAALIIAGRPIPSNLRDIADYISGEERAIRISAKKLEPEYIGYESKDHTPDRAVLLSSLFVDPVNPNTPEMKAVRAAVQYPRAKRVRIIRNG